MNPRVEPTRPPHEPTADARGQAEVELAGLKTAMQTRAVIEQAKGMLMAERRIDADSAFALLVEISQSTHRKLVDVAKALVAAKMSPPPSD